MRIGFGGLASGIDTDSIVKDMMKVQRLPIDRMNQKMQMLEWQRDAYRAMNTQITDFRSNDLSKFRLQGTFMSQKINVTGDTTAISAKTVGTATTESLTVKVGSLATAAANWSHTDIRSSVDFDASKTIDNQKGNLDADPTIFNQTQFTIKINDKEVNIDTTKDSLDSIIDKINKNTDVSAFYDTETGKVSLKSKETGLVNGDLNGADITFVDDGTFLQNVLNIDNTAGSFTSAADATVTLNGLDTTRTSNIFTVNGIEVTLLEASTTESTIQVTRDTEKTVDAVKEFVESYNEMLSAAQSKLVESKYPDFKPLTAEQKSEMGDKEIERWEEKAMSGLLKNDPILSRLVNDMRLSVLSQVETDDGRKITLGTIGLETGDYSERGKLYLDEDKLRAAIEANPDDVMTLFTNEGTEVNGITTNQGIGDKMYQDTKEAMDRITQKAGYPASLSDNSFIGKDITRTSTRILDSERRLAAVEERYYRQFTAMETAIQRLNSQSDYLFSMLNSGTQ